tara:strand:+ start:25 stop:948 length:924 start_codon:yes stop_codon:yes gene_type:complete
MFKKFIIFTLFLYNIFSSNLFAFENKILFKINNEIISTIDIYNEISYLKLLNPDIKNLDQNNLYEIAKNSLIREHIKKIELIRNNINLNIEENKLEKVKKNFSDRLRLNSEKELENFLKQFNLNKKDIIDKLIIESMWNSLIVKKFIKDVKIDEEKVKKEIGQIKYQYEYDLSEIVFELKTNENLKDKYLLIKNKIKQDGFVDVALSLSISETSKTGGALGWIKQGTLSKVIKDELINMKPGDITKPIVIPGGILVLKINNQRKIKKDIDIKKEMQMVIRNKTNEQLNQYSILYFNKVKKDILINEL